MTIIKFLRDIVDTLPLKEAIWSLLIQIVLESTELKDTYDDTIYFLYITHLDNVCEKDKPISSWENIRSERDKDLLQVKYS